eukprot:scaffold8926_cov69-Phaeocystis_antarctica.AAC.2
MRWSRRHGLTPRAWRRVVGNAVVSYNVHAHAFECIYAVHMPGVVVEDTLGVRLLRPRQPRRPAHGELRI